MLCSICLQMRLSRLDKQWSDAKFSKYHNAEKSDFYTFHVCHAAVRRLKCETSFIDDVEDGVSSLHNSESLKSEQKKNNPNWRNVRSPLFHTIKSIGGIFLTFNAFKYIERASQSWCVRMCLCAKMIFRPVNHCESFALKWFSDILRNMALIFALFIVARTQK